jgi:alpha,alpha-trehalase
MEPATPLDDAASQRGIPPTSQVKKLVSILSPHWPETLGVLAFPILYRGLHLHLRISGKGAIISVDPRDARGVEVECRGHVVQLTPGSTVRFRG